MAAAPRDGAIGVRECFPLAVRSVSMSEHIDFLREVLAESDALEGLAQEGALPDWLSERG
jgi:hypothetical protein